MSHYCIVCMLTSIEACFSLITPTFSFSPNLFLTPVLHTRLVRVFCDVESETIIAFIWFFLVFSWWRLIVTLVNFSGQEMVFSTSKYGNPYMRMGRFRFCTKTIVHNKIQWRCVRQPYGCRAKVTTIDGFPVRVLRKHNHWQSVD